MKRLIQLLLTILAIPLMGHGATDDLFFNRGRGYGDFRYATTEGILLKNSSGSILSDSIHLPKERKDFSLTFTACEESPGSKSGVISRNVPAWGFFLLTTEGKLWVTLERGDGSKLLSTASEIKVTVFKDDEAIIETTVSEGFDVSGGPNVWRLTASTGHVILAGGNHGLHKISEIPFSPLCEGFGFAVAPGGDLRVRDISLVGDKREADSQSVVYEEADLKMLLENAEDPLEGIWALYDRALEETLLRCGGDYRLAIIRNGESFDMVYLSGARVNTSAWHAGMLKGRLRRSPFDGIYHVEWIDSEGKTLSHEIDAQTGEDQTLQIQFPYQQSTLRLRKIRQ